MTLKVPVRHPEYGTDAWRDMVLAGRLPCEDHPKGCSGLVTLPMPWPFSGLRDEPCVAPSWCWCGEPCEEAGRVHEVCWRATYAVAFAVDPLALAFAPLNEARLAKAFGTASAQAFRAAPQRHPSPSTAPDWLPPVGGGPERLSTKKAGA